MLHLGNCTVTGSGPVIILEKIMLQVLEMPLWVIVPLWGTVDLA